MKLVTLDVGFPSFKQPLEQQFNSLTWSAPNSTPYYNVATQGILTSNQALNLDPLTNNIYGYALGHTSIIPKPSSSMNQNTMQKIKNEQAQSRIDAYRAKQAMQQYKLNNTMNLVGQGADMISSLLPNPTEYNGTYGSLAQGINTTYDQASNMIMSINPLAGGIMKAGSLVNKGIKLIGGGTDGQTTTDAILGSNFLGLTPVGLINGFFGKRSNTFYRDDDAMAEVGGSYQGSNSDFITAANKSNKKYGLFSGGARRKANRLIANAQNQMNTISDIASTAERVKALDGMANYQRYQLNQNGGPRATYVAAKGTKLRIKRVCNKIHKKLKGGKIEPKPFEPIITLSETIKLQKGGNVKPTYEQWLKTVPTNRIDKLYDLKTAYEVLPFNDLELWRTATDSELANGQKHLGSVNPKADANGNLYFLKLGKLEDNSELQGEFNWYNSDDAKQFREQYAPAQFDSTTNRYFYPKKFENGGSVAIKVTIVKNLEEPKEESTQKNVIPEGALHARKHNIENTDSLTQKGIPVVDDKGEQQAEIEQNEIILNLKLTNKLEELQKQYEQASKTEQDKLAIEAGKLLVQEILYNTIDNTGLIDKCEKGGKLNESK